MNDGHTKLCFKAGPNFDQILGAARNLIIDLTGTDTYIRIGTIAQADAHRMVRTSRLFSVIIGSFQGYRLCCIAWKPPQQSDPVHSRKDFFALDADFKAQFFS
mgnify:CR=1 FL=1